MELKIGIIGNGGIANAHMDGYKALGDEVQIVACCDINFPKAKAYAEKMIATDEDFASDIYVHIGDIYSKCGDIERALQFWIKAQESGDDSKNLARKIKKRKYIPDGRKKK